MGEARWPRERMLGLREVGHLREPDGPRVPLARLSRVRELFATRTTGPARSGIALTFPGDRYRQRSSLPPPLQLLRLRVGALPCPPLPYLPRGTFSTPLQLPVLSSLRSVLAMAGSKRSKLKKALSPPFASSKPSELEPAMDDDALMDDLMAQLDSKDTTVQAESATVLHEMNVNKAADTPPAASPPPQKQDSKARHRARMVCRCWHASRVLG